MIRGMTQQPRPAGLTADAFIEWVLGQPGGRYELADGEVVAMAPERLGHTRVKRAVWAALASAIAARGLGCEAIGDGASLRIDDRTVCGPDGIVRCGPRAPSDAVELDDPVVVIEVVSPSSGGVDTGVKLADYFRLPTVRHYLVLQPDAHVAINHRRDEAGDIVTRIVRDGSLVLDPPGLELRVADLFATV
jgi:Uma2 family endonuclease